MIACNERTDINKLKDISIYIKGFLLLCVLLIGIGHQKVYAYDHYGTSASGATLNPSFDPIDGTLTFQLKAKQKQHSTCWGTAGIYVTPAKTGGGSAKYYATSGSGKYISLSSDANYKTDTAANGIVYTKFYVKAQRVQNLCKAHKIDLGNLKYVYLQGVLRCYNAGKFSNINYYTYSGICSTGKKYNPKGISWSNACYSDWLTRFDIEVPVSDYYTRKYGTTFKYFYRVSDTITDKDYKFVRSVSVDSREPKDDGKNYKATAQWVKNCEDGKSIKSGNGLNFKENKYEWLKNDTVDVLTRPSIPKKYSEVIGTNNVQNLTKDHENLFLYHVSFSKHSAKIMKDMSPNMRERYKSYTYKGYILKDSGGYTDEYKDWYRAVLTKITNMPEKGLEVNACYKKATVFKDTILIEDMRNDSERAKIQSDIRTENPANDTEVYDSTKGIPSSEPQYVNVWSDNMLYAYEIKEYTGKGTYSYHSGCHYVHTSYGGYTSHGSASVERSYSYWKVEKLGVWKLEAAQISNMSLPGITVTLPVNSSAYQEPIVKWEEKGKLESSPSNKGHGGGLPEEYMVTNDYLEIDGVVILDGETFKGNESGSHEPNNTLQAKEINKDVFYKNDLIIPPELANNEYPSEGKVIYTSIINKDTGYKNEIEFEISDINSVIVHTPTVCYPSCSDEKEYCQLLNPDRSRPSLVLDRTFTVTNSSRGWHSTELKGYGSRDYTKFISKKEVRFEYDVYSTVDGAPDHYYPANTWIEMPLVMDSKMTFYIPTWVNEGEYNMDFRNRAINCDANVLYVNPDDQKTDNTPSGTGEDDVTDYDADDDEFVDNVEDGEHDAADYDGSVVRNDAELTDEQKLDLVSEKNNNLNRENYVSADLVNVVISGRLFGLNLYDYSDYPAWGHGVFRVDDGLGLKGLKYTLGMKDRNGDVVRPASDSKYTLPMVNGSHPYLTNYGILKPGYTQRFNLTTMGDMFHTDDYIKIVPKFYYVAKDGSGREEVELYYNETIDKKYRKLVKVGSETDLNNLKYMSLGGLYTSVPDVEMHNKAEILGISKKEVKGTKSPSYSYGEIKIPSTLCTYVGLDYVPDNSWEGTVLPSKVTKSVQKWYFEYSLPSDVHAISKKYIEDNHFDVYDYAKKYNGMDYKEDFWLKGGYILVQWDTVSYETYSGITDSTEIGEGLNDDESDIITDAMIDEDALYGHLSYINAANEIYGYCNMWKLEGFAYSKTDTYGATFNFVDGDALLYYLDNSRTATGDYESFGTH